MKAIVPMIAKRTTTPTTTPTIQIIDFFFLRVIDVGVAVGTIGATVTVGRTVLDVVVSVSVDEPGRVSPDQTMVKILCVSYHRMC